jgi:hypothetical protein
MHILVGERRKAKMKSESWIGLESVVKSVVFNIDK